MPETLDGRAKSIIDRVIDLDRRARIELLERECAGDIELGRRVESLLSAMEKDDAFLQQPTVGVDSFGHGGHASLRPGGRIGPYTLIELIGEGGFGSVFLAEQTKPVRRQVALKIIKLGMDTRQVIARFEAERQALALMDHPNISRVLDVGATDSGRPYFVMELVRGEHITDYCDRQRLSISERLAIFRDICGAVQHAHQKGVIHRDLKPSNVLVTVADGRAIPKVIDFGIAKATAGRLTDLTLHTAQHQLIGTPEYMSPEQAESSGADIDTRSDVYSLGVLLYELLTGNSPFSRKRLRSAPFEEVQRILREEDPPRPSLRLATADDSSGQFRLRTRAVGPAALNGSSVIEIAERRQTSVLPLTRAIRGDLDWIVLKCLEKDRSRRYETASALADDIGRHLGHEPVLAMPPTASYRMRKFARRYWAALSVVSAFVLLLIGATIITLRLYGAAELARSTAAEKAAQATARLWDSLLAQARAGRAGMAPGRRFDGLEAIRQAAAIKPSPELRDEAIACMGLEDVIREKTFEEVPFASSIGLLHPDRFAYFTPDAEIRVVSVDDGRMLHRLPGRNLRALHVALEFSGRGRYLAAKYSLPGMRFAWDVWDLDSNTRLFSRDEAPGDLTLAFSQNDDWIALTESDQVVHFRRLPTGEEYKTLSLGPERAQLAIHPSGALIAVSKLVPPYLNVLDMTNDRVVAEFEVPSPSGHVSWSNDGKLLAVGGGDTTTWRAYVWDFERRRLLHELVRHQGTVTQLHFHPHLPLLATCSWDNTSRFWDLATGRETINPLHGWLLNGFGDTFACRGPDYDFAIWRFDSAREVRRLWADAVRGPKGGIAFSADGAWLMSAAKNGVSIWDIERGTRLATLSERPCISGAVVSSKSSFVLAATAEGLFRYPFTSGDGASVQPGEPELIWQQHGIQDFCSNAAEDTAIAIARGELVFIDLATGQAVRKLRGHSGMDRVSISPNGRWLFVDNWKGDAARLWDVASGEVIREFPGLSVKGYFSPDGRKLLIADASTIVLYEADTWLEVRRTKRPHRDGYAGTAAFSNDGTMIAWTNSRYAIQLVDVESGQVLATLPNPDLYGVSKLRFSLDDRWLAIATVDRLIECWDLQRVREGLQALGLNW